MKIMHQKFKERVKIDEKTKEELKNKMAEINNNTNKIKIKINNEKNKKKKNPCQRTRHTQGR